MPRQIGHSLLLSLMLAACFVTTVFSQDPSGTPSSTDWMHVRGDSGDFSIEVPSSHRLFYNSNGFSVFASGGDQALREVYMLTAYTGDALISLEIFEGGASQFATLYDQDAFAKDGRKVRKIKVGDADGKEVENRTDKYYSLRWFLRSKHRIFILTAASRTGEVPAMRRFLDSLKVSSKGTLSEPRSTPISKLKTTEVEVEFDLKADPPSKVASKLAPDPSEKPGIVVRVVRASFAPAARENGVGGTIRLRMHIGADGFIPKITVNRTLPNGLLRQALFAALRAKFIPMERNGVPIGSTRTVEFGFHIG